MSATRRIDLTDILQQTVSAYYGDLVTRRTGQAVRVSIEPLLDATDASQVTAIDFSTVRCLDLSCADEIVGKLLLQYGRVRYFLLTGVNESHQDAIEPVLERHGLAVVAQDRAGRLHLLGVLPQPAREAFDILADAGRAAAADIAARLNVPVETARDALRELEARHLIREEDAVYQPLRCA